MLEMWSSVSSHTGVYGIYVSLSFSVDHCLMDDTINQKIQTEDLMFGTKGFDGFETRSTQV